MHAWIEYPQIDRPLIRAYQAYLNTCWYEICVSLIDYYLLAIDGEFHTPL